jgi:hypothetical protein
MTRVSRPGVRLGSARAAPPPPALPVARPPAASPAPPPSGMLRGARPSLAAARRLAASLDRGCSCSSAAPQPPPAHVHAQRRRQHGVASAGGRGAQTLNAAAATLLPGSGAVDAALLWRAKLRQTPAGMPPEARAARRSLPRTTRTHQTNVACFKHTHTR